MDRATERLALIELLDRDGRCVRAVDVTQWPLRIGRALDNDLVLDDPFVAAAHATLGLDEQGALRLQVGDSVNGVAWQGRRLHRGEAAALPAGGALLQLGGCRLRLRLPGENLAAERPLPVMLPGFDRRLAVIAAAVLGVALLGHGLVLDPGVDATAWLPPLVGVPLALAGWCGLWALLSKLFQHRFDFAGHLRVALPWLLAIELVEALLPPLAASLGWPWLWRLVPPALALLLLLLVRAHLAHLLPQHRRAVSVALASLALVGGSVSLALNQRVSDSFSRAAYMSTLPLPALDFAPTSSTEDVLADMAEISQRLAGRARQAREAEAGDEGTD